MVESIQIDEDNPDVKEIMHQIRAYIAERKLGENGSSVPPAPVTGRISQSVYDHLFQAIDAADRAQVKSNARRVQTPIVGALLTRMREMFHDLIIYYLGRVTTAQIRFNMHAIKALRAVIHDLEQEPTPAQSDARIAELEARVASLEAGLAQLRDGRQAQAQTVETSA